MKAKIVIIEDEAAAARHLQKLINSISRNYQLLALLTSVKEAIHWFGTHQLPDLLFMDIRLSDGLAFKILEECFIDCPIIFTTAYDEYALPAFKTSGIDYLLKPITHEELAAALSKFEQIRNADQRNVLNGNLNVLSAFTPPPVYKERFLLKKGNQFFPTLPEDIAYFYRDELVLAKLFTGENFVLEHSLNLLQQELSPKQFVRLNRAYLVNFSAIKKLTISKPGQLIVSLKPEPKQPIELSQKRSRFLRNLLNEGG